VDSQIRFFPGACTGEAGATSIEREPAVKALAEKISATFGKKQVADSAPLEHPNFWMYQ